MTFRSPDDEPVEPLPADVAQLLARGSGHADEPGLAVRARLRSRLLGVPPAAVPSDGARQVGGRPPVPSPGRGVMAHPIALALATYAVGVASGAVLHARLRPQVAPAFAAPPRVAPAVAAGPSATTAVGSSGATGDTPNACPTAPPAPPERDEAGNLGLGRERALLDQARAALVNGDSHGALAALDRHRRGFPDGRLAEERDVLGVRALLAAGRTSEARRAAARFLRKHPSSLFRPAVERAIGDAMPPD